MTGHGYDDPRSIYSEQNRRRAGTRTPREILANVREKARQGIVEGHGLTDVSCHHGSRWLWWVDEVCHPKGAWAQVVLAPDCDCPDPPRPIKEIKR